MITAIGKLRSALDEQLGRVKGRLDEAIRVLGEPVPKLVPVTPALLRQPVDSSSFGLPPGWVPGTVAGKFPTGPLNLPGEPGDVTPPRARPGHSHRGGA
ncbi:hypothetical protein [Longispora albida]|uniref:hypothetical protein n=1 Tax=Longispora albida TaxID=203523 RepID=UPI00037E00D0|nr:hypothetical protein [Longispora albida]